MSNDVLITPASRKIELKDSNGNVDAKIETDASGNLLITNAGGDISIGDTTSDVFIGDGTNSVDIVFEQSGEIRGTSGVTLTLGDANTTLRTGTDLSLNSNDITNVGNITTTNMSLSGTMTLTGAIDYTPDNGTLIKFDGQNILTRNTANGAITFGHDDAILITAGDTTAVMNANINEANETIYLGAEGGFVAYAFPNNDTTWSNRKELSWNGSNFAVGGNNVISAAGAWVGSSSGLKGEPGAKGNTGSKGEPGAKGNTGAKGDTGLKGQKGEAGAKGATGEKGAPGAKGQKGDAGAKGDTGAKGQKGEVGQKGATGNKGQKGQSHITGSVAGVSNSGWTTAFTVVGSGLGSQVRATFVGTANNVVVNTMADIIVNHSQDILVETKSGYYTLLSLRVISDNNEDFAVQVKTNHANTVTLAVEVFPLNNETVTITTSHSYTGSTYTHDGSYGVKIGGTGGNNGDLRVGGDYYAGTTKVINANGTWAGSSSGLKGEPGAKGQKGEAGAKGQKGEIGVKGVAGVKGQKGEPGAKGATGAKGEKGQKGEVGQKGNEAGNAGTLDGYDSSRFMRRQTKTNATVGPGWMTVATNTSGRKHGEVIVTDADSGDHAFVRIDWMRSYADSNFSVLQCGGHANRITGARVLYQTSDNTYGVKLLQVYVTTSSNYEVNVYEHGDIADYDVHTAVTPVIENSKTGYALHGSDLTAIQNVSLAAEEAISANGYYVDNTQVINASGVWVGSSSGLKGEPGAKGQKGEPGTKGATGAKGQKGEPGAKGDTGAKGQKGEIGVKGITGQKGQKGESVTGSKGQKGEIGQKGQQGSAASDASRMDREDNRTISPSELTAGHLKFGFTSWANNNTSPYADFLHMRSYTDSSGGSDNLLMLKKSGLGARVWQQTYGSSTAYSNYVDLIDSGGTAQSKSGDLTIGSAGINARLILQKADNNVSDHVTFYTGSTKMGEIGAQDTTWLRINQHTAKNIYTPRMFRADGGLQSKDGTATAPAYTFYNDTNTGMYRYGADQVGITAGGTARLVVGSTITLNTSDVRLNEYLYHTSDTDTYMRFTGDRIRFVAGGATMLDMVEGSVDYTRFVTRGVTIGNNTAPQATLTVEQSSTVTPADGGGTGRDVHLRLDNSNTGGSASTCIIFNADDGGGNTRHGAGIQFKKATTWGNASGSYPGELYFWTRPSSGNQAAAQKLDKDGNAIFKGNVTAYGSLSDRRLKENIENIPDATEKVQQLNGVTFNYKKDGKKATGLIAQELQEVLPEAVYTSENIETGEEHLAIHYGNVIGLLVESIKELKSEIEELKKAKE